MKRLVFALVICLGCFGILEAQDIWKPINVEGSLLGVSSDGSIFAYSDYYEYVEIVRSLDEGETWQVVLSSEPEPDVRFLENGFAISEEGRIFVLGEHQEDNFDFCLFYSDDNGDTWQQTTEIPNFLVSGMVEFGGITAPTNDIIVCWSSGGDFTWSLDGGATWNYTSFTPPHDGIPGHLPHELLDVIVNESGELYATYWLYCKTQAATARTNIYEMSSPTSWDGLEIFSCTVINDMEYDPEGNALMGYVRKSVWTGYDMEYYQGDRYYVFEGQSIAVSDNGVVYKLRYTNDLLAVLNYSLDHGEHFYDIGEALDVAQSSSDLFHNGSIFKGRDNHLYFYGRTGQYYKSIQNADHITNYGNYVPLVHEGNDRQKWNVVYIGVTPNYPNDYHTEIQSIRDDINLDGVDYKLVWKEDVYDSKRIAGAVREEDKRVYFRRKIEQNYQEEVLLYDFNLMVGDTVTVNWMGQQLMVLEESEVEVDGTMRRQLGLGRYSVGYPPTEVDEYWIEGVGSTFGFLNSGSEGMGGAFIYLLCYHENGNLVWDNEAFDECVMNSDGAPATFAPQGAEWYFHVLSQGPITQPPFYYLKSVVTGTEEVQGHLCSVIDGYRYVYEEDDVVYMYVQSTDSFTVMYDFNAEEGDTWYCDIEEGFTCLVTVESVGSVTWNGHTYRTQYVTGYIPDEGFLIYDGRIIEGIGYEKGLFPHEYVFDGTEYEYMRCYLEDGELLYHEGDYDCDYVPGSQPQQPQFEWYYEIENEDGTITYQYLYQAGDTIIQDEPTHILVRINTLYDKGLRDEVTHEYVYERDGKLYWWNKTLEVFTVLYDYEAEVGDYWEIIVGTRPIDMHVDAVEEIEYEGRVWRMLRVSDPEDLFSGNIVCGIGHLTSFFPERLMGDGEHMRVDGLRCYWSEGELVFKYGDEDCDAVISDLHGVEDPSTGSVAEETLVVYPNPTNGVLNISVRLPQCDSPTAQTYRITNVMGQTLLQGTMTDETLQIDVRGLAEGMYFVTVAGETRKFVVR